MANPNPNPNHHHTTTLTTTTTTTKNRSTSDTDSQFDEYYSPLHEIPTSPPSSKAIVTYTADKFQTTVRSPTSTHQNPPQTVNLPPPAPANVNSGGGEDGGTRRPPARRMNGRVVVDRAALGFRVLEAVLSVIAFSVMASDKTQGWSGDSFDRYKEYRYVVAVNAIGFAYATFQAIDMTYRLSSGEHIISFSLRPLFDFLIDQILAYLLISASSSAASRVDDWVSNWGKDDFTEMATASIGMSFLAFFAFALSSLISGYNFCSQKSL